MKKFKNGLIIKGVTSLRKAFEEELLKLGYTNIRKECKVDTCRIILVNENRDKSSFVKNGEFASQDSHSGGRNEYTLPQDWNLALQAASEVEEEIPKYVKCTHSYSSNFIEGNIYRVISWNSAGWELCGEGSTVSGYFKPNYSRFEISTKAAYDLQQQELTDKELLEKLIKESGLKIGDVVYCNYKNIYTTDKQQFSGSTVSNRKIRGFKLINGNLAFILEGDTTLYFWCKDVVKLPQSKILTLGSSNIEIKISKGGIEAAGREVGIEYLVSLLENMKRYANISNWDVSFKEVKIGCSTFTLVELEQIVETYNELNK